MSFPGGGLNLILEYLDADLEMIIKNGRAVFSQADIKAWMMMMFRGVHHCHSLFILHRDLKVIFDSYREAKQSPVGEGR